MLNEFYEVNLADERPKAKDVVALLWAAYSVVFPAVFISIVGLILLLFISNLYY